MNILGYISGYDGCGYYRVQLPAKFLNKSKDVHFKISTQYSKKDIDWADIIILQKQANQKALPFVHYAKQKGKKVVTECFTHNNEVITDAGLVSIGDIVSKEMKVKVSSDDGKFYPITKYFSRDYTGYIYNIKTWYLYDSIECTADHTFLAHKRDFDDDIFDEIEAKHLRKGDYLKIPFIETTEDVPDTFDLANLVPYLKKGWEFDDTSLHKSNVLKAKGLNRFVKFDEDLSRLFGYFLLEGCVEGEDKCVSFSFHINEIDYHNDVKNIIKDKFGLDCWEKIEEDKNTKVLVFSSVALCAFFNNIFGKKVRARTKKVPLFYFHKNIKMSLLKGLFCGLFRGDGSNVKQVGFLRGARLTSSSKTMLYQIHNLLLRFEIISSIYRLTRSNAAYNINGKIGYCNEGYELKVSVIDSIDDIVPKLENDHKTKNKNLKGKVDLENRCAWIEIKKISRELKETKVYNICVEPRHKYNIRTISCNNCDDDYFNIPVWNPAYKHYYNRHQDLINFYRMSDAISVTTPYLAQELAKYNPRTYTLPNSLELTMLDRLHNMEDAQLFKHTQYLSVDQKRIPLEEARSKLRDKVVIGWGGSPTHLRDLEQATEALIKITNENENVLVVMMACTTDTLLKKINPKKLLLVKPVPIFIYPQVLASMEWDIGICPIEDNKFNRSKSNLKYLEFAINRFACVCSNVENYAKTVTHGVDGLLSDNTLDSWYNNLKKLIEDKDSRKEIAIRGEKLVREKFAISENYKIWEDTYKEILSDKR